MLLPWPLSPTGDNLLWLCESATIIALLNVVPFAIRDSDHIGHVPAPSDPEEPKEELEDEDESDDDGMFASLSMTRRRWRAIMSSSTSKVSAGDAYPLDLGRCPPIQISGKHSVRVLSDFSSGGGQRWRLKRGITDVAHPSAFAGLVAGTLLHCRAYRWRRGADLGKLVTSRMRGRRSW